MAQVLAETVSDPAVAERLWRRRAEREALLERIAARLWDDERIVTAWVHGSVGRGEADDLSDLDVFVVADDPHLEAVITARQEWATGFGGLLYAAEAPQNRPPGGAYLGTAYEGSDGPQQVDWLWQTRSQASLRPGTRLLFDRVGLPRANGPVIWWDYQPIPEQTPEERAAQGINGFWLMLLVTAKYAARSPREPKMGLWRWALGARDVVRKFLDLPPQPRWEDLSPHPEPTEKVRILREAADEVEALSSALTARGVAVSTDIAPAARRFIDFVAAIMDSEGEAP